MIRVFLFLSFAALASAQQPSVENAKLESRVFSGSLAGQIAGFGAGPVWVGYSEAMIPGRHGTMCNGTVDGPLRLEGQTTLVVLVRVENSVVDELRLTSPDCRLDAGGLPFYWIGSVPEAESVTWLKSQLAGKHMDSAVLAIALQAGTAAEQALTDLTSQSQPERVREKAAFWLGNSRGARGVEILKRMLADDPSEKVREQVVFGLSQSKDTSGMAALIDTAKNDRDPRIRSKALFWLAQKAASRQSADTIKNAVANDPDLSVKEQAVFALKQLPEDQGVPLLIDVAKNNPDLAVRKKAMFWLGQSRDPRAIDFFALVLK